MKFFGLDGCKYGWITAQLLKDKTIQLRIIKELDEINNITKESAIIGIDIPLELHKKGKRNAEKEARRILGSRASTIFSSPSINTLQATSYIEACRINYKETGLKISKQSWYLFWKIKQARKIYLDKTSNKTLYEIHPELSFMAMNKMEVIKESKKTIEGRKKRLDLIRHIYPSFDFGIERNKFLKKDVADDDILDVLAVLWSTQKIIDNIASHVPKLTEKTKSKIYF